MHIHRIDLEKALLAGLTAVLFAVAAPCQTILSAPSVPSAEPSIGLPGFQVSALRMDPSPQEGAVSGTNPNPQPAPNSRLVPRTLKRLVQDQKQFYFAPFKPSYFKWDALVLLGTGALIATDRRIENQVPTSDHQAYQNASNIAIGGLAASLAGVWIRGIKTDNPHAKEMGELELEALSNAFLIYAPMQFIAGRQRPGEGNGNGDFWRHHSLNTSFPAGHAMFTWTMATVVAHEYPKPWVKALAYGAVSAVSVSRMLARDHWASDMFVGSVFGFSIATHVFHAHCDPEFSESCHRPRDQR